MRRVDEVDGAAPGEREIVGLNILRDDLLVSAGSVRDDTLCRELRRVQPAVGAYTQRACPARVLLEHRHAPRSIRLVDRVARRIGEENVPVLVHCRTCGGGIGLADLLPELVSIDQRVDGAARPGPGAASRRRRGGRWSRRRRRRRRHDLAARHELREDAAARAGLRLADRDRLRIFAPEPSQRVGQHRRAVAVAVTVFPQFDLHVVAGKFERGGHPGVFEVPAAGIVHQILTAGLHEDANGPRLRSPDQAREPIGAPEVAEAADPRNHTAELVGPVPRRDERADAAGADAGDAAIVRILREVVALADFGDELFDQEVREARRERVVLENPLVAVLGLVRSRGHHAGVDEDRDHRRHVALRDQIVEDDRHAHVVPRVPAAIQKDHERNRPARVVLRRHVHLIVVRRAGEEFSRRQDVARDRSLWSVRTRL